MAKKTKSAAPIIGATSKPVVVALLALALMVFPTFAAQKVSPSAVETGTGLGQTQTNAYTALKWSFGNSGRKFAQDDTLTYVKDSAASVQYVQTRDVGPKARNLTSVNYNLPDSLVFCMELARADADTNTTTAFFQASANGGTYFTFPSIPAATSLGIIARGLYCVSRPFVPGIWIKPQQVTSTATDTVTAFSAILFTK